MVTITSGLTPRQVRVLQLTLERERRRLKAAAERYAEEDGLVAGGVGAAVDTALLRLRAEAAQDALADRAPLAGLGDGRAPADAVRQAEPADANERLRAVLATLNRLEAVERALHRIDEQAYGRCEACGQSIAFPRLVHLPWTRQCHQCARVPWEAGARGAEPATARAATSHSGEPSSSIWWFCPPAAEPGMYGTARVPDAA